MIKDVIIREIDQNGQQGKLVLHLISARKKQR